MSRDFGRHTRLAGARQNPGIYVDDAILATKWAEKHTTRNDDYDKVRSGINLQAPKWYKEAHITQIDVDKATKRNQQVAAAQDYKKFKEACAKLGKDLKRRARGEEPRAADFAFSKEFITPLRTSRVSTSSSPMCADYDDRRFATAISRVGCSGGNRAVSVATRVSPRVSSSY